MQNHTTTPPRSVWNAINKKLLNTKKHIALISIATVGIILSVFLYTNRDKKTIVVNTPISSTTQITNNKQIIVYQEVYIKSVDKKEIQKPSQNVIIASTNVKNVSLPQDTIINKKQNNSSVDSIIDYQGFNLSSKTGCVPLTIVLENIEKSNNLTWNINNTTFTDTGKVIITLSEPDNYKITLTRNDNGQINTFTNNVVVNPQPIADFSIDQEIIVNEEIIFENLSSDATNYLWFVNNQLISSSENTIHRFYNPGNYKITLIASNEFGCSDTIQKNVEVIEPQKHIVCPTAFSPNLYGSSGGYYSTSNSKNDIFHPFIFGKEVKDYSMKIFNRKGVLMFVSSDITIGWDGYYQNQLVPIGVYIYSIKGTFTDGETFAEQGSVTVLYDN